MAIYDKTVTGVGKDIRAGLEAIAKAIGEKQSVTYNVNVIVTDGADAERTGAAAEAALERIQKREARIGTN